MNEELIHEFRKATGWSEVQTIEELKKVECNYYSALKFYLIIGRLPSKSESEFIKKTSFDKWHSWWSKGILN